MSSIYQDPQIIGNTIYVAGQAVAVITAPEGTTLHQGAVSVLSGEDAYQAGREAMEREVDIAAERLQAFEEGRRDGYDEGEDEGYRDGHTDGYRDGHTAGYHAGHTAGYEEGYAAALKEHGITGEEG